MKTTTTTTTTTSDMPLFTDLSSVIWVLVLFVLGCVPTWSLIKRSERRWREQRGDTCDYYHQRTHSDLVYLWGRRIITLNAGFYFMTALSLTPPGKFLAYFAR